MNTLTVDIQEAQDQLARLLTSALEGDEVIISKNGTPLVTLAPVRKSAARRTAGLHRGAMRMHDDFDDPLPDDFWLGVTA